MKVEFWGQEFQVNMFVGCIGGVLIAVLSSMFGFGGGPSFFPFNPDGSLFHLPHFLAKRAGEPVKAAKVVKHCAPNAVFCVSVEFYSQLGLEFAQAFHQPKGSG